MEIGEGLHWLWTLGLTAWVVWRGTAYSARIREQRDLLNGMFKVVARMQRRVRGEANDTSG